MLAPKPVLAAAGLLAPAAGAWLIVLAPGAERVPVGGRGVLYAIVVVGWAFAAIGAVAVRRRPESAMGALLVAFGLVVLATGFWVADDALAHLLAAVADPLGVLIFVHLLLAVPATMLPHRAGP